NTVGFSLSSPSAERIDELIESYMPRLKRDFFSAATAGRSEIAGVPADFAPRERGVIAAAEVSEAEHEEFFRKLLWDVDEPTAPFGLLALQGDGRAIAEARAELEPGLAQRLRDAARSLGVSEAALWHVAWAQVVARTTGRDDVVFGTVLPSNTLPLRIAV